MKAIRIHQPGGPEALQLDDVADPSPGGGQAAVKLAAAGVNYIDVAPNYANAEEKLGPVMQRRRKEVFLVTKVESQQKPQILDQIGRKVLTDAVPAGQGDRISDAAEALLYRLRDLAVGADGSEEVHDVVGVGLEYSLLPQLSISGAELSFYAVNGDVRIFPFRGAFFIGMAGGRQHLR